MIKDTYSRMMVNTIFRMYLHGKHWIVYIEWGQWKNGR